MQIVALLISQYQAFLQLLQLFLGLFETIRNQRKQNILNDESDLEFILIFQNYFQNVVQWLHLVEMWLKYFNVTRRRRRLVKPHILLQLLSAYRCDCFNTCII